MSTGQRRVHGQDMGQLIVKTLLEKKNYGGERERRRRKNERDEREMKQREKKEKRKRGRRRKRKKNKERERERGKGREEEKGDSDAFLSDALPNKSNVFYFIEHAFFSIIYYYFNYRVLTVPFSYFFRVTLSSPNLHFLRSSRVISLELPLQELLSRRNSRTHATMKPKVSSCNILSPS